MIEIEATKSIAMKVAKVISTVIVIVVKIKVAKIVLTKVVAVIVVLAVVAAENSTLP